MLMLHVSRVFLEGKLLALFVIWVHICGLFRTLLTLWINTESYLIGIHTKHAGEMEIVHQLLSGSALESDSGGFYIQFYLIFIYE